MRCADRPRQDTDRGGGKHCNGQVHGNNICVGSVCSCGNRDVYHIWVGDCDNKDTRGHGGRCTMATVSRVRHTCMPMHMGGACPAWLNSASSVECLAPLARSRSRE